MILDFVFLCDYSVCVPCDFSLAFCLFVCLIVLSYSKLFFIDFIIFYFVSVLFLRCMFLTRDRKNADGGRGGEELGVVVGKQTEIEIYCMKATCNKRKK